MVSTTLRKHRRALNNPHQRRASEAPRFAARPKKTTHRPAQTPCAPNPRAIHAPTSMNLNGGAPQLEGQGKRELKTPAGRPIQQS